MPTNKIIYHKINFHYLFLIVLSLNYIIPLIFFGKITLFYPDALEQEIVLNKLIGEFAKGNFNAINLISAISDWRYVRRLLNPVFYFYAFNFEFALRSRVAQWWTCWARNPKVRGTKPRSAISKCAFMQTLRENGHAGDGAHGLPYAERMWYHETMRPLT